MLYRQILCDEPARAAQLRIAERSGCAAVGVDKAVSPDNRISRTRGMPNVGRGVESVEILRRIQEIVAESGLRYERQRGSRIFQVQVGDVVFDLVGWVYRRFYHAQILRLCRSEIWIDPLNPSAHVLQRQYIGKRVSVWNLKRLGGIHGRRQATLGEVAGRAQRAGSLRNVQPGRDAVDFGRSEVGLAKLFAGPDAVVVFLEMFPDKIGLQILGWLPAHRHAARPEVAAVDALVGDLVERVALTLCPLARDADIQTIIDDGQVDHAFEAALMIIAEFARGHRFELVAWLCGSQIHYARRRVASVQRALRSPQHLDLGDVVELLLEEMIANERNVVEGDGDGRIGCHRDGLRADAANLDRVAAEVRFRERQVRHLFHEIGAACGLCGRELFLAERGDGNGDALNVRAAQLRRGDRDGFHRGARRRRSLGKQDGTDLRRFIVGRGAADDGDGVGFAVDGETGAPENIRQ